MSHKNLFMDFASPEGASEITDELKSLSSNLRNAKRELKKKKKKGVKKKKLEKLEKKIIKLKKDCKKLEKLNKQLRENEYALKYMSYQPWWLGIAEKSAPKLIDFFSVLIQGRRDRPYRVPRQFFSPQNAPVIYQLDTSPQLALQGASSPQLALAAPRNR